MPFMVLDPKIFDRDEGVSRTCPGCNLALPVTSEFWTIRRTGTRTSYCKKCCVRRTSEWRERKKRGEPAKRARCACCGEFRSRVEWIDGRAFCPWCRRVLAETGARLTGGEGVVRRLMRVREHNRVEADRQTWWEGHVNRRRPPHRELAPDEWVPYLNHANCLRAEETLVAAGRFLRDEATTTALDSAA